MVFPNQSRGGFSSIVHNMRRNQKALTIATVLLVLQPQLTSPAPVPDVKGFFKGMGESVKEFGKNIYNTIKDPNGAIEKASYAIAHPIDSTRAFVRDWTKPCEEKDKSKCAGKTTGKILISAGTLVAGPVAGAAGASGGAVAAIEGVSAIHTAGTVRRAGEAVKKEKEGSEEENDDKESDDDNDSNTDATARAFANNANTTVASNTTGGLLVGSSVIPFDIVEKLAINKTNN